MVLVTEQGKMVKGLIDQILKFDPKAEKGVKICKIGDFKIEGIEFLLKHSSFPVLAIDTPDSEDMTRLLKSMPQNGLFLLNIEDERVREMKSGLAAKSFTFGLRETADLNVGDININGGINFKISHKGNFVPFWLDKSLGKENIGAVLMAASIGIVLGFNLVEISQAFKSYKGDLTSVIK